MWFPKLRERTRLQRLLSDYAGLTLDFLAEPSFFASITGDGLRRMLYRHWLSFLQGWEPFVGAQRLWGRRGIDPPYRTEQRCHVLQLR